jgi:hypothetical protein
MADLKITNMTSLAAGTIGADVLHIIDDPTGTPINKKVTVADMLNALAAPVALATGDITITEALHAGRISMIPDQASGNPSLTLPTPILGMVFRFTYVGAAIDAHNTLIVPPTGVDYEGSLAFFDRDGNATSVVPSDNSADDTLTIIKPENFDIVLTATSTTKYHISGYVTSDTAPTIA